MNCPRCDHELEVAEGPWVSRGSSANWWLLAECLRCRRTYRVTFQEQDLEKEQHEQEAEPR